VARRDTPRERTGVGVMVHTSFCVLEHIKPCSGWEAALPYATFVAELERAGLSVRGFAELIGMNPNSITNYKRTGTLPQHIALVAVRVAEMAAKGLDYRAVIAKVAPTRQPRGATRQGRFGGDRQATLDLRP
jgi:hypothetical protein